MTYYGTSDIVDIPDVKVIVPGKTPRTACAEENDLLNGAGSKTAIKMQDAPFSSSRTGSEEDMLEYEEGTIINCDSCKLRRRCTLGEKLLITFSVICLIVIIALAVSLGKEKQVDKQGPPFCNSKECLRAASSLLSAMDPTADPCEDFHQYACGGWLKETPIPPGYPIWNRFQELSYKNLYVLKNFIESFSMFGSAERKVKQFYTSCMEESKKVRTKTVQDFRTLIRNMTEGDNQTFQSLVQKVHKFDTWPFFKLLIGPDERNPENNIIKIDLGETVFPGNLFADRKLTENTKISQNNSKTKTTPDPKPSTAGYTVVTNKPTYMKWNVTELVEEYLSKTYTIFLSLWNMTSEQANQTAYKMLELEKRISTAHGIDTHIHNRTHVYNVLKLSDLQSKCSVIDWNKYLSSVTGKTIKETDSIVVLHEKSLQRVCDVLESLKANITSVRLLKMYTTLSLVRPLQSYFDENTFEPDLDPEKELENEGEHWRRCTFYTNKAMGFATGAIYVNGTSQETSVNKIKELVDYVKKAFKQYLLRKIWLDKTTKDRAASKIDEMIEKVSYPNHILNSTFLDEYYQNFTIGADWFANLLNWKKFTVSTMVRGLGQKHDRHSWINAPVTVESDYSPVRNDIIFPIAMFHLPLYSPDGPSSINFGAMGSIIGHEITHAFDIQGRQYDGTGRLKDWWDPITADSFNTTTRCMKDQYDKYSVDGIQVNGEQTLDENIADNGGIRAAHIAYELWLHEHGNDSPLPGVTLNNRQIFYVSFAQMFCSKWKKSGVADLLVKESHSPGPIRIKGALSNSQSFSSVFKCSYTSAFNPDVKCQVW